jgi:hypothetical protein
LFKTLNNLSPYYRDQLDVHGANVHDIRDALGKLAGGAGDIVAAFQGVSSKGAPRNVAVMEVIRRLKRTFRDYYQGPRDLRKRRGAFQFLATWERTELSFIALALRSARISFTDQALQRLLRDPRCALPQERAQTIETIARKAHSTPPQQKRNKR